MRDSARSRKLPLSAGLGLGLALSLGAGVAGADTSTAHHATGATTTVGSAVALARVKPRVKRRPTMRLARGPKRVRVVGRTATRSSVVVVQRKPLRSGRWVRVKRTRSHKRVYRTRTRRLRVPVRYRVRERRTGRVSPVRVVRPVRRARPRRPRPASPPSDACGVRPRKDDGSLWSCTFHDEFNTGTLDRQKWVPQTRGYLTGVKQRRFACYTEDNVTVRNGHLRLRLRKRQELFECQGLVQNLTTRYTAGSVTTHHLFSQRYGRFEARMRNTAARVPGLHEAFWLWPDDREVDINWPVSGEIDVAETYSVYPNLAIPFLHYANPEATAGRPSVLTGPHANTAWHCRAERGTWNTYRLEWGPQRIEIYVNDRLCLTNTSGDPAFREKYILAFTQGIGARGNEATDDTPIPAFTQVDWVRVWQ